MSNRAIIAGIERFCINRGWNVIQCDNCGIQQSLERSNTVQVVIAEARDRGWLVLDEPRRDLCPMCAEGMPKDPWAHHLKDLNS